MAPKNRLSAVWFNNLVVQIIVYKLNVTFLSLCSKLNQHNRNRPCYTRAFAFVRIISFSRKEVIHRHVLVPMPCYDLTPIISPTLGRRGGLRVLVTLMV